jgi:lipopolysaccharide transport system permease protein
VLYTLLFGVIAGLPSDGKPYAVFAYTALLPWGFFSDAVGSAANTFVENRHLMAKIYFPRLLMPLARMISGLVDLAISFVILIFMLIGFGIRPNWGIVLLPVLLVIAGMAGLAVGLWFSGIVARYRDFGQVAGYLVRTWMYATPVVYSMAQVPEKWRTLYQFNPLVGVVEGFRWALLNTDTPPNWGILAVGTVVIIIVLIGGLYYFRRTERSIVDIA